MKPITIERAPNWNRFQTAIDIQDACNMRAIAREFVTCVDAAMEELQDTRKVWSDPAVVLLVSKLESLSYSNENFSTAYAECKRRAAEISF